MKHSNLISFMKELFNQNAYESVETKSLET